MSDGSRNDDNDVNGIIHRDSVFDSAEMTSPAVRRQSNLILQLTGQLSDRSIISGDGASVLELEESGHFDASNRSIVSRDAEILLETVERGESNCFQDSVLKDENDDDHNDDHNYKTMTNKKIEQCETSSSNYTKIIPVKSRIRSNCNDAIVQPGAYHNHPGFDESDQRQGTTMAPQRMRQMDCADQPPKEETTCSIYLNDPSGDAVVPPITTREGSNGSISGYDSNGAAIVPPITTLEGATTTIVPPITTLEGATTTIVEAFRVQDNDSRMEGDVEETVRQRILEEAVQAEAVVVEENQHNHNLAKKLANTNKWILGLVALVLVFAVVVGIALGLLSTSNDDDRGSGNSVGLPQVKEGGSINVLATQPPTPTQSPAATQSPPALQENEKQQVLNEDAHYTNLTTLQDIRQRGFLRCGVYDDFPGFSFYQDGNWSGFNYEICRALSAAVFDGDATKFEPVVVNTGNRFVQLSNRSSLDVISQAVTFTLGRDIVERSSQQGFTFSYPYYFSGLVFGGIDQYVDCADQLDSFNGICRELKVCVAVGTTQEALVRELLPGASAVPFAHPMEVVVYMMDGRCNVIAGEAVLLNPTRMQEIGFNIPNYKLGSNTLSRDPLSIVTRDGIADRSWSNLVNSVIQILFTAESMNLTKANIGQHDFENAAADGQKTIPVELQNRMKNVIQSVGNYNEMYKQQVEGVIDIYRLGSNMLNRNWDSGLLQYYPYGEMDLPAPQISNSRNSTIILETIRARGYLKCGIVIDDDRLRGLAGYDSTTEQYYGIDVEYCRALSAALFVGDTTKVQFVRLRNGGAPINSFLAAFAQPPFAALSNGLVDVLAGQEVSLTNQYFEPTTGGLSFTFSEPYFYYKTNEKQIMLAMATRQAEEGDDLWSSFVYWIGMSLVYAEERGITSLTASEMPTVRVFGDNYIQSFRDCIYGVGNYEEIYNRTLQETTPRSGGNLLNSLPFGPQQVGYPLL